jgi:hypothetical protein
MWLQEESMPEELKPNKSHVVMWVTEDSKTMLVSVDPNYPDAWRKGEMGRLLRALSEEPNAQIGIIVGKERFPLLPEMNIARLYDEVSEEIDGVFKILQ